MDEKKIRLLIEQGTSEVMNRIAIETGISVPIRYAYEGHAGSPIIAEYHNPRNSKAGLKHVIVATSPIEDESDVAEVIRVINSSMESYLYDFKTFGIGKGGTVNE